MNETKMTELTQAEDMAYFRADLCLYSPESYSLEEKKQICNDMMATSNAVLDAIREDFQQMPPELRSRLLDMLCQSGVESPPVVVGYARGRRRPALPRAGTAQLVRTHAVRKKAVYHDRRPSAFTCLRTSFAHRRKP